MSVQALLSSVSRDLAAVDFAQRKYAARLAPGFSIFRYLPPDELGLSRILASLLDPGGDHKQGSVFLREFVDVVLERSSDAPSAEEFGKAEMTTERLTTRGRRIDIAIDMPSLKIAIENKPWADHQPGQLKDYAKELQSWSESSSSQNAPYCLIHLSADREPPPKSSIATSEWELMCRKKTGLDLSYADLLPWLDRCVGLCRSTDVQFFLRQLQYYIRWKFEGVTDMEKQQSVVDEIMKSPENLQAALEIDPAVENAKDQLLARLEEQLEKTFNDIKLRDGSALFFKSNVSKSKAHQDFCVSLSESGNPYYVSFEFGSTRFQNLTYGLTKVSEKLPGNEEVTKLLQKKIGPGTPNHWWLWNASLPKPGYEDWSANSQPWLDILNGGGNLVKMIVEETKRIFDVLEEAGLLDELRVPVEEK